MSTDLPIEVRRAAWGWFGPPWPSYVCYDENDRLIEEMRIPAPVGELCIDCDTVIQDGDRGQAMPCMDGPGRSHIGYIHVECQMIGVVGPLHHVQGKCAGLGQCHHPTLSRREEALAVWDWISTRSR